MALHHNLLRLRYCSQTECAVGTKPFADQTIKFGLPRYKH
ncbi:Uncharacterised protein [Vibrio cholerae]|nr:Uncharacterised protein [Vibrio cholerae]CSI66647.1 Uncharacterised protein [Vibrio cholerae]